MNTLHQDITNHIVVIEQEGLASPYHPLHCRLFQGTGGAGAKPHTFGRKIFGRLLFNPAAPANEEGADAWAYGFQVERLATAEDLQALAQARLAVSCAHRRPMEP